MEHLRCSAEGIPSEDIRCSLFGVILRQSNFEQGTPNSEGQTARLNDCMTDDHKTAKLQNCTTIFTKNENTCKFNIFRCFPVPRTRLELARPVTGASPSSWCVYQFHHLGINLRTANVEIIFTSPRVSGDYFSNK